MAVPDSYETDFHAWALEQAAFLRAEAERDRPDFERVAEEVEGLAIAERRVVDQNLTAHIIIENQDQSEHVQNLAGYTKGKNCREEWAIKK